MTEKLHFVVVCGYGCNINSPLTPYLERVASTLNYDVESVVLCGGETQQEKFPGKSEASVMFKYLQRVEHELEPEHERAKSYILEDNSYTTYDNIEMAARQIRRFRPREREDIKFKITIFCETQRALKVILLSRHFMADLVDDIDDIRVETYNWERANPDRELKTTILTRLAIKFPMLARWESEKKKRLSKNR